MARAANEISRMIYGVLKLSRSLSLAPQDHVGLMEQEFKSGRDMRARSLTRALTSLRVLRVNKLFSDSRCSVFVVSMLTRTERAATVRTLRTYART